MVSKNKSSSSKSRENPRDLANARERTRMERLNNGFDVLRNKLPSKFKQRRLSKADTLRCAIDYIKLLEKSINHENLNLNQYFQQMAFQKETWNPPPQTN